MHAALALDTLLRHSHRYEDGRDPDEDIDLDDGGKEDDRDEHKRPPGR
ncbi:MAG: hypothetical protein QG597_686 [Actinomycetota bacterium]|nr:hypothetical protein [Actinomycetota bacterium]